MRDEAQEDYLEVIGEHEQSMPDAGYRLNLCYNGPMGMRNKFMEWADSLRKQVPDMVLTSENIYIHYMPEQIGQEKIRPEIYQTSVSYNITVADSAMYGRIMQAVQRECVGQRAGPGQAPAGAAGAAGADAASAGECEGKTQLPEQGRVQLPHSKRRGVGEHHALRPRI